MKKPALKKDRHLASVLSKQLRAFCKKKIKAIGQCHSLVWHRENCSGIDEIAGDSLARGYKDALKEVLVMLEGE